MVARKEGGETALIHLERSSEGDHAAAFLYGIHGPGDGGYALFVYVIEQGSTWQLYDKFGTQNFQAPDRGASFTL